MKTSKLLSLFLGSLLALTVLSASAAETKDAGPAPKKMRLTIATYKRSTYVVEIRDGELFYSHKNATNNTEIKITPTPEQWQEFRQTLDELKVWKWHNRYDNPDEFEGATWSILVEYSDRNIKTGGRNGYPDADGDISTQPLPTHTFFNYLKAVQKLLGGKDFK